MLSAGALLDKEIGDAMWLPYRAVLVVKFELEFALKPAGIKGVVVGKKSSARSKRQNETITAFSWSDCIRSQKAKADELIKMRSELLPYNF